MYAAKIVNNWKRNTGSWITTYLNAIPVRRIGDVTLNINIDFYFFGINNGLS